MTSPDLFPEIEADKTDALRRRTWARHQHSRVIDPNDNERYTLRPTIEICMRLAKVSHIDIDVSACPEAHWAEQWLGLQVDGSFVDALTSSWRPKRVNARERSAFPLVGWENMPYSDIEDFTERTIAAMLDKELDVVLALPPGDRCEQPWWQKWIEPYRDGRGLIDGKVAIETHCLPGRQRFGSPGDPAGIHSAGFSAPFPSVLVVYRCI